jgi:methyl-accepting chemotaxis protein
MSHQIEKATLEQVSATNLVAQLIEKVNVMIQQISMGMKEMERGTLLITDTSERIRTATQQLKISTENQDKEIRQISDAGENVTATVQHIAQTMNEQKEGSETIMKSVLEIQGITQVNVETVRQLDEIVKRLIGQANLLKDEVHHFKI